jgi:hypothetical protein
MKAMKMKKARYDLVDKDSVFVCPHKKSNCIAHILTTTILSSLFVLCFIGTTANGQIFTSVYLADSNTSLDIIDQTTSCRQYDDIMVGSRLKIVISSDSNVYWGGDLGVTDEYWPYCFISQRAPLQAAGLRASVYEFEESDIKLYGMYAGDKNRVAGNWFIADYNTISVGDCKIGFYDEAISLYEPIYYLCFSHVPTRDFNNDKIVDFQDFNMLLSYWMETDCVDPYWCQGADIDRSGIVNIQDLVAFCEFWLERTD